MPTTLPPRRQADEKRSLTRTVASFLFNAAMMVSALILAFIVLVREEQYAFGNSPLQLIQQSPVDTGESQVIRPSN